MCEELNQDYARAMKSCEEQITQFGETEWREDDEDHYCRVFI